MGKYTKGKWVARFMKQPLATSYWVIEHETQKGTVAGQVFRKSDAQLIASAPDLLEASKRYYEVMQDVRKYTPDDYEDASYQLVQAIAKAKGE